MAELLLSQLRATNTLSIGQKFDGHEVLYYLTAREIWHIIASHKQRCLIFVKIENAAHKVWRICSGHTENLKQNGH